MPVGDRDQLEYGKRTSEFKLDSSLQPCQSLGSFSAEASEFPLEVSESCSLTCTFPVCWETHPFL